MDYKGNVAIVTGASSGIGTATAELLQKKGATVVGVSRHGPVIADFTKPEDIKKVIEATFKQYGRIDILVNNAGRGYDSLVEYIEPEKFREIFALDLLGPVIAMQEVIPIMRKQGGGVIVNVSSGTALMHLPGMSPYAGLKSALALLSLTANAELAKDHITVSVVYPVMTATNFEKNTLTSGPPLHWEGGVKMPKIDPPELIAEKILEAIETSKPELFAHEWMKKLH